MCGRYHINAVAAEEVKYSAASYVVFDPRGIRQIDLQVSHLGSSLAGIKKLAESEGSGNDKKMSAGFHIIEMDIHPTDMAPVLLDRGEKLVCEWMRWGHQMESK